MRRGVISATAIGLFACSGDDKTPDLSVAITASAEAGQPANEASVRYHVTVYDHGCRDSSCSRGDAIVTAGASGDTPEKLRSVGTTDFPGEFEGTTQGLATTHTITLVLDGHTYRYDDLPMPALHTMTLNPDPPTRNAPVEMTWSPNLDDDFSATAYVKDVGTEDPLLKDASKDRGRWDIPASAVSPGVLRFGIIRSKALRQLSGNASVDVFKSVNVAE